MRISILLVDGAKQVMLTPETDYEKQALKLIAPRDVLEAVTKWGRYTNESEHAGIQVEETKGGYYREFSDSESLMFVIKSKDKENNEP